ncbi:circadian-associated transcriptional repressor [Anolis carolinensis]|nr:PREDICTED: circadian-associated transcriptional repressor [Anolis carolinensis]|eukprot:XP_008121237.1 PREDICTED: circadian-associated transcriptional repressor [Anolis carolinensis]
MAIMESSHSISSRESLYSVESEEEEEDHQHCGEFEDFISDSGSDTEKEPVRTDRRGCFFSPRSRSGRTNPALLCPKRRSRKPLDSLAPAKPQPLSPCCRYPVAAEGEYCKRLTDTERSPLRPVPSPNRLETGSGRKRSSGTLGGGRSFTAQLSAQGKKRQRNEETEDRERSRSSCWTEKDHLFAQKCWELQGFVRPLMELLHRLRMGRLNRGLSSFQQSVAMDRIQRIIGVLQKPEMGERYLGTLLQVERMLKVWFPHVSLKDSYVNNSIEGEAEERCKMAKGGTKGGKHVQGSRESPPTEELLQTHLTDSDSPDHKAEEEEPPRFQGDWPAMNMTWIHTSPISNPPLGQAGFGQTSAAFGQAFLHPPTQAYGVVVFLQDPTAPGASVHTASLASVPSCCRSEMPLPSPGGPPRCQSMPSATRPVGCYPRGGTLSRLSRSLPNLPASSTVLEGLKMPAHHCTS